MFIKTLFLIFIIVIIISLLSSCCYSPEYLNKLFIGKESFSNNQNFLDYSSNNTNENMDINKEFIIDDSSDKCKKINGLNGLYCSPEKNNEKILEPFSNLEGIGIPPIEAALSGNKVIGYTGGGGIEYWKLPLFKKIESGEIDDFGQILLKEIKNYKSDWVKKSKIYRKQLSKQYSEQNQTKSLINLMKIIKKFYN